MVRSKRELYFDSLVSSIAEKEKQLSTLTATHVDFTNLNKVKSDLNNKISELHRMANMHAKEYNEWVTKISDAKRKAEADAREHAGAAEDKLKAELEKSKADFIKALSDRESAVKAKENEFNTMREQIAQTEEYIKNKTKEIEANIKKLYEDKYAQDKAALEKEFSVKHEFYELKIGVLNERIAELVPQLKTAREDLKNIATLALSQKVVTPDNTQPALLPYKPTVS